MRISGPRSTERQLSMWPEPISSMAQTRNHCGEFAEQLTAIVVGGHRLKTDSRADYCPDILCGASTYVECKSVGRNGYGFVFEGRRAKDQSFNADGRQLLYLFWRHRMKTEGIGDVDELRRQWCASVKLGILVPFALVDDLLTSRPLKRFNVEVDAKGRRLGYGQESKGYSNGRTLPLSLVSARCNVTAWLPSVELDERSAVTGVQIHTIEALRPLLQGYHIWHKPT